MPEDVKSVVVSLDLEVAMVRRKPTITHFRHFNSTVSKKERARSFLSSITCVAFDSQLHLFDLMGGTVRSSLLL